MGDGVQHGAAERLVQMLAQFVDMRPQGAAAGQIVAPAYPNMCSTCSCFKLSIKACAPFITPSPPQITKRTTYAGAGPPGRRPAPLHRPSGGPGPGEQQNGPAPPFPIGRSRILTPWYHLTSRDAPPRALISPITVGLRPRLLETPGAFCSVGRLTGELQTWALSWSFHQPLLLCASGPAYFPVIAMVSKLASAGFSGKM